MLKGTRLLQIDDVIQRLEDCSLNSKIARANHYNKIQNALDSGGSFSTETVQRLLAVCLHDMQEDLKFSAYALKVILAILSKILNGEISSQLNLLPTALEVLKMTNMTTNLKALNQTCFEALLSYPDDTLIELSTSHTSNVCQIIDVHMQVMNADNMYLHIKLLIKILKIMPPGKIENFIKQGLSTWFSRVIQTIMSQKNPTKQPDFVEVLELLADALVPIEYADNQYWQIVLECIYNPSKYPSTMKSLLLKGNDSWHRLWMVFIKLLKNQITKVNQFISSSPINAMLPVVEQAFKMDPTNRCRAFQCWNVLIDNFSSELNEGYVNKRIKLLIIPLRSNNAKVEETAMAKLYTWWHLIRKFHSKIDNFTVLILIPFLHFCFGKPNVFTPGQMTDNLKQQSVQVLVEIVGHVNCDGCTTLPKLKSRLISTKILVDHWSNWIHSLKTAIENTAENDDEIAIQQVRCLWKGFLMTLGELPDNNIRKDLFNELINIIQLLLQVGNPRLGKIIFNVLIYSLFDNEDHIIQLIKTKTLYKSTIQVILSMLQDPMWNNFYSCQDPKELALKWKPILLFLMNEGPKDTDHIIEILLKDMIPNDHTLLFWTALAESWDSDHDVCVMNLSKMLLWPLKNIHVFSKASTLVAWYNWYILFNLVDPKVSKTVIDEMKSIVGQNKSTPNIIILCASLAILKYNLTQGSANCEQEVQTLQVLNTTNGFLGVDNFLEVLIDTLVLMMTKAMESKNVKLAMNSLSILKILLKSADQLCVSGINTTKNLLLLENLFKAVESLIKVEDFSHLKASILDHITRYSSHVSTSPLKNTVDSIIKTILSKSIESETTTVNEPNIYDEISDTVESANLATVKTPHTGNIEFPAPTKGVGKKSKKKEASIVNTVMENGEEYVVVKSNWKFNPRKLTENQKEKLKRKREDIPALYQDLSQSQDEFKLTTWKTDSQDTSNTSSKSTSKSVNEDVSIILKNLPSSDVVPKIMENMMSENIKESDTFEKAVTASSIKNQPPIPSTARDPKTPRLALKDRVFRNVRNLIEKSGTQNEIKVASDVMNQTINESVPKTPSTKAINSTHVVNSAPSKINLERPSRVIKKPSKFNDTQVFSLKKTKRSQLDSQKDPSEPHNIIENKIKVKKGNKKNVENESSNPMNVENSSIPCVEISDTPIDNIKVNNISVENVNEFHANETNKDKLSTVQKSDDNAVIMDIIIKIESTDESNKNKEPVKLMSTDLPVAKDTSTPKPSKKKEMNDRKSSLIKKRSRIESQLSIDTVEGHPLLQSPTEKRARRKSISIIPNGRRSPIDKIKTIVSPSTSKYDKQVKKKESSSVKALQTSVTVVESQNQNTQSLEELPMSEDIIESSQDSTLTMISVKSNKNNLKKVPIVVLDRSSDFCKMKDLHNTQSLLDDFNNETGPICDVSPSIQQSRDDIELPKNITMIHDKYENNLTENMDTEPIADKDSSGKVIIINDDDQPIVINTEDTYVESDTQEIAEADTQPINILTINAALSDVSSLKTQKKNPNEEIRVSLDITTSNTHEDMTKTMSETIEGSVTENAESTGVCSPFKDDDKRKNDFLNNTMELSPIKILSPVREDTRPSPETSSEYVLIKLTSPVQSNGEPFEKCDSPEIFTEDKVSPDKRDQSPPRVEVAVNNTSPSSSLSLKKNRCQVRASGRAAQIMGLCAPDKLQAIMSSERSTESEESKKSMNTPARRNLRMLYTPVNENSEDEIENESSENFLKFKRSLPTANCSPAVPILKRKHVDMVDEATVSPASKRKRVSFHDPPVSTTVAVHKYIEPIAVRSPQSSSIKRQERQIRVLTSMKSPKRLDNSFKLDSVLTKAVESFGDDVSVCSAADDTEMSSIDETPIVEVVKTSDLNDTEPICPELSNCKDPISNIAGELSSSGMKSLLVIELTSHKIDTIADLAKLTELEVNRLRIKAPKVKIAKTVLTAYALKKAENELMDDVQTEPLDVQISIPDIQTVSTEVQTNEVLTLDCKMQTDKTLVSVVHTQTDYTSSSITSAQTDESGSKSTGDVITCCLLERPDFVEKLGEQLEEISIAKIAEKLSHNASLDLLTKKMTASNSKEVIERVLAHQNIVDSANVNGGEMLLLLQDYLCQRFSSKDLILFSSRLLKNIYDKP